MAPFVNHANRLKIDQLNDYKAVRADISAVKGMMSSLIAGARDLEDLAHPFALIWALAVSLRTVTCA